MPSTRMVFARSTRLELSNDFSLLTVDSYSTYDKNPDIVRDRRLSCDARSLTHELKIVVAFAIRTVLISSTHSYSPLDHHAP